MLYCALTENNFEDLSDKPISIFVPSIEKDENGKDIVAKPAQAVHKDFIYLGFAAIIAAATYYKKDVPIELDRFLVEATPMDVATLLTAIVELRSEWYGIPNLVEETLKKEAEEQPEAEEEQPKNA